MNLDEPPYPYEDCSFDMVVAMEVIEHLERPFDFFKELTRILKTGGTIILTTPNVESEESRRMFFETGNLAFFESFAREPIDGHRTPIFSFQLRRWIDAFHYSNSLFYSFGRENGQANAILIMKAKR